MAGMFSAFMGGFLGARGVQNNIQQSIDNGIARDIAAQESDKRTAQQGILNKLKLNDLYSEEEDRKFVEEKMNRIARRANLVTEMQAQILRMKDPILVAEGQKAIAAQKLALAKEFEDYRRYEVSVADREAQRQVQQIEGERNRALQRARMRQAERARNQAAAQAAAQNTFPATSGLRNKDGSLVTVQDKDSRKAIQEVTTQGNTAWNMIEAAKRHLPLDRFKNPVGADKLRAEAWAARLMAEANGGKFGGQFTDKDAERALQKMGFKNVEGSWRLKGSAADIRKVLAEEQANIGNRVNNTLGSTPGLHGDASWQPQINDNFQKQIGDSFSTDNSGGPGNLETFSEGNLKQVGDAELANLIVENPAFGVSLTGRGSVKLGKHHQNLMVNALDEAEARS
jgi:hypothetical protein